MLQRLWCPPDDDAIVNRKAVSGQSGNVPFTYLDRVPKCGTERELAGARDPHPAALLTPLVDLVLCEEAATGAGTTIVKLH